MSDRASDKRVWRRRLSEQLLLAALRDEDAARNAIDATTHARALVEAGRALAESLDGAATCEVVRHLTLPRGRVWCIADVVEDDGTMRRLPVATPDGAQAEAAARLEASWPVAISAGGGLPTRGPAGAPGPAESPTGMASQGADPRLLIELGVGPTLVVPLVVRGTLQGFLTFIAPAGALPFSSVEVMLAMELGTRAALALDNARLYRCAESLRVVAEQANQSKVRFLASMSHELRTPLNAIGGYAQLLEMGLHGPTTPAQLQALGRVRANQLQLLRLITDILEFARAEEGQLHFRKENFSLGAALADVLGGLEPLIAEKGLVVDRRCMVPVWAMGDPDRTRQVLVNLVMNAVKYTPAGGRLTLECGMREGAAFASVQDSGDGMPAEQLEAIFHPFVQLDGGLNERRGGVGLGLAISRQLAAAMGGSLTAASELEAGSCFTLTLPAGITDAGDQGRLDTQI